MRNGKAVDHCRINVRQVRANHRSCEQGKRLKAVLVRTERTRTKSRYFVLLGSRVMVVIPPWEFRLRYRERRLRYEQDCIGGEHARVGDVHSRAVITAVGGGCVDYVRPLGIVVVRRPFLVAGSVAQRYRSAVQGLNCCRVGAHAVLLAASLVFTFADRVAHAGPPEPWVDVDPAKPPKRLDIGGNFGVRGGVEYRAQATSITPLSLNTVADRNAFWIEHRARLDGTIDYEDKIRLTASADLLDSVLWGDNGTLGKAPESDAGANVNTRQVNVSRICTTYKSGSIFESNSYGLGLCPADPVFIRRLYADVRLPIGLLRIGRQAATAGAGATLNDGDGRTNRFGISYRGNSADRVLFATKPLEAFKPKDKRNVSEDDGLFLILAYDHLVNDSVLSFSDNLHQWVTAIRVLAPKHSAGSDLEARVFHAYRWDSRNSTSVNAIGARFTSRFGNLFAGADGTFVFGSTREISEAFSVITKDPVVEQKILQVGGRATVRYDQPKWTAYLEADYASGDSDPQSGSPLTQFRFAEDSNVGLLMFEHVLAYQTARAAAAGIEILKSLNAPTIPVESVATRGSFTNAAAIFPQFDYRPIKDLLFRGGVLMAWAPSGVNDPIASQQRRDGRTIEDDLVNFAGGKPGNYYGTELDARIQWRFKDHFIFDLEGAVFFPGSALQDENGNAVRSVLVQGRTTVFF